MSLQCIDVSSPQSCIDAVVSAMEVERPNLKPYAAPNGTVTVMFTDMEGSTAMTERLGTKGLGKFFTSTTLSSESRSTRIRGSRSRTREMAYGGLL